MTSFAVSGSTSNISNASTSVIGITDDGAQADAPRSRSAKRRISMIRAKTVYLGRVDTPGKGDRDSARRWKNSISARRAASG